MFDNVATERLPRRAYLKTGGALVTGGLLAGCTGESNSVGSLGIEAMRHQFSDREDAKQIRTNDRPPRESPPGNGTFYAYHLNEPGFWMADTRPLGATDVFADETWGGQSGWRTIGYEALFDADPEDILHMWGLAPGYDTDEIVSTSKNHPVGQQLSAIQNDRFYAPESGGRDRS
jgi:hypothetical protein